MIRRHKTRIKLHAVLACSLLVAPSSAHDDSSYPKVYIMQPAERFGAREWREFQARQDQELERVRQLNSQQYMRMPVRPYYNPPRGIDRRPPPSGPSHPPVMREFKDEFSGLVTDYIKTHSEAGNGPFVIDDAASGRRYPLKLSHIHTDRIRRLAADKVSGCVDFETASGPKASMDLDFFLERGEGWIWDVSQVLIHSINGKPRYAYDAANRIVAVAAPKAAPRVIPKPTQPAHLTAEVAFSEPSGTQALQGGETGRLSVKVSNAGPGPAYAMRLSLDQHGTDIELPAAVELGDLAPGQSATKEVSITAPEDIPAGKIVVKLAISEANGFDTEPVDVELETRPFAAPKLELAGITVGGTGVVAAGEPTKITVRVRNSGKGAAREASATLTLGSPDIFMSGEPTVALGTLEPGRLKSADFEFFANKRFSAGQRLPVSLAVDEASKKYGLAATPLNLTLGEGAPAARLVTFKGRPEAPSEPAAASPEDVDAPPPSRTARSDDAYAVVVGIEKYRDLPNADFAARDAGVLQSYLTQAMGFDPKNVILLQNERATLTDLTTYLGPWLKDRAGPRSRIFVYYAGHGASDPKSGRSYLVPYDGDPAYAETKAFPLQQLYDALAQLPTDDITVALDACFSGAGGRSVIAKGTRPLVTAVAAPQVAPKITLLAAAGGEQISTDEPDAQHGMLTYYLLKGLHGEAQDGGGRVTTRGLFSYIKPAVERAARMRHVEQSPVLSPSPDQLGKRGSRVWLQAK